MEIIYGIIIANIHEGGHTEIFMYESKNDAEKEAMKIALAYNEDGAEYVYTVEAGWNDGSDYIVVREFRIKPR